MKKKCVCVFICVEFIVPLIWRSQHCRWSAVNFDLCSAFMAIEHWGFLYATHLLWHGSTLFNCHLRSPVTHTPFAERLAVELSLPVFMTHVCHYWGSNPNNQHARRISTCEPPRRLITVNILPLPVQLFFFKSKRMVLAIYCLYVAPLIVIWINDLMLYRLYLVNILVSSLYE